MHLCGEDLSECDDSGAMPDGAEAEGVAAPAAAPLLVIGTGPMVGFQGTPWVTIPDPGPGGTRLRAALQSCQDRSHSLRGDVASQHDQDQFRNFLGHELRSPLTAIKTALSVLALETRQEPGSEKMLGIAQRNLARLTGTVEWSQELLSLAEAPPAGELGPVSLKSLATALPNHLDVSLDPEHEDCEALTDPRLLGMLAVQMERVLDYASPGSRPAFRLGIDPGSRDCHLVARVVSDPADPNVSGTARTGGLKTGLASGYWNRSELHHLVRMLISPHLLQGLGVRPRLTSTAPGTVELFLGLPRWAGKFTAEPSSVLPV